MLSVLLVDDEALTRSGLRHSIPWERYDMRITHEASGVEEALRILEEHQEISLVFTDIVMPVHNGIELLRRVRVLRPSLPVAVLTYHNDFAYAREALRLGAVDYINKTELEQPAIDATLRYIQHVAERSAFHWDAPASREAPAHCLYVHLADLTLLLGEGCGRLEMDEGTLWLLSEPPDLEQLSELEKQLTGEAFLLSIHHPQGFGVEDLRHRVRLFRSEEYYYYRIPHLRVYEIDMRAEPAVPVDSGLLHTLRETLCSFTWLHDEGALRHILDEISGALLAPMLVHDLFLEVWQKWITLFGEALRRDAGAPFAHFHYWHQWVDWILSLRQQFSEFENKMPCSSQIYGAIQRLILRLKDDPAQTLSLDEAAAFVNLSTSYFAKCFQRVTGAPYVKYTRDLRLDYAKTLLQQTSLPVARVAELSGLPDPFHFSKLFKRRFGQPPSVYRGQHRTKGFAGLM